MKFNGYRASHRNKWLLLTNKILDDKEFLLFEYYLDCSDWDATHKKHGVFEVYFEEIAPNFDKTPDAIRLWHNGLLKKGFVRLYDKKRNLYEIKNPERYGIDGRRGGKASKYFKDENSTPTMEFILENICFFPEKIEINPPKTPPLALNKEKALTSYKCESSFISNTSSSIGVPSNGSKKTVLLRVSRSDAEYQKLYEKNNREGMTPENMKLADEVTEERTEIESDEQEKEIVEIFFNNDWNEYKKNLLTNKD